MDNKKKQQTILQLRKRVELQKQKLQLKEYRERMKDRENVIAGFTSEIKRNKSKALIKWYTIVMKRYEWDKSPVRTMYDKMLKTSKGGFIKLKFSV